MKEAAGEANMTVITIVLIGVVAAVGAILIPRIMKQVKAKSCCQELGGFVSGSVCLGVGQGGNTGRVTDKGATTDRWRYYSLSHLVRDGYCD